MPTSQQRPTSPAPAPAPARGTGARLFAIALFVIFVGTVILLQPVSMDGSSTGGASMNHSDMDGAREARMLAESDGQFEAPAGGADDQRPIAAPVGYDGKAVVVDWRLLGTLNYMTAAAGDELQRVDGRVVLLPGFIIPLDDFADEVTEFLLVPYFGACVHVPPPPPNQMVYVKMAGGARTRTSWCAAFARYESWALARFGVLHRHWCLAGRPKTVRRRMIAPHAVPDRWREVSTWCLAAAAGTSA